MSPLDRLSVTPVRLAAIDSAAVAGGGLQSRALLGVVDRVVALVAREGGFAREDAPGVWAELASAATGTVHTPSRATGAGGADVYGIEALGRALVAELPAMGPAAEGEVLRALDGFTRAVALQVSANRRQPAATALGPVALAVAGAGAGSGADPARALVAALSDATRTLERGLG